MFFFKLVKLEQPVGNGNLTTRWVEFTSGSVLAALLATAVLITVLRCWS